MEDKTIHLKWDTIIELKEKKQWAEAIELAHEIEALLLKHAEEIAIVHVYLVLSDLYLELSDIDNGLKYLTLSESVVLQLGNWKEFINYTDLIIRHRLLHFTSDEFVQYLDKVIPIAFENEQYEPLSHCFIIQSYLHLKSKEVRLAIQEAKMAYFYSKIIEKPETSEFSDTAKLFLVLALIRKTTLDEVTYYIEEFNWQTAKAIEQQDTALLECIHSMILLLNNQFAEGLAAYNKIFTSFLQSEKIMHDFLLFEQMSSILKKVEPLVELQELTDVQTLMNDLQNKYNQFNEI